MCTFWLVEALTRAGVYDKVSRRHLTNRETHEELTRGYSLEIPCQRSQRFREHVVLLESSQHVL